MDFGPVARKRTYGGLFMVTLATLMYEILLTRIFSVTMWYHFAFVALSVAMFGMTVGALLVYLLPQFFTQERVGHHLAVSSLLFPIAILFGFLTHLSIPFLTARSIVFVYSIALNYAVLSLAFIFSGVCVCLALTKFPRQISHLYAADLAGAALGCLMVIFALSFTDGPTSVMLVALLASIGCVFFSLESGDRRLLTLSAILTLLLSFSVAGNTIMAHKNIPLLRLVWVKGRLEPAALYEKWNSFSRIAVRGDPSLLGSPFGWGLSSTYPPEKKMRQLTLDIDANASTVVTHFDGKNWDEVDYLKYDVTNMAHYLRPSSNVLVVGTGGGRDILSALAFQQKSVLGVEINGDIIRAVNGRFGDFSGHLDWDHRVRFVNDEARSYIARQTSKFDIIQISLIDSWAATAAGAFVLAENSLYTTEAWKVFFEHISPNGLLTVSRWYYRDRPGEVYRLVS